MMPNSAKLILSIAFLLSADRPLLNNGGGVAAAAAAMLQKRQDGGNNCHCYNSITGGDMQASTEQVCANFGGVPMGAMWGCNCWCAEGCSESDFNIKCGYHNPVAAGECILKDMACPWNHE